MSSKKNREFTLSDDQKNELSWYFKLEADDISTLSELYPEQTIKMMEDHYTYCGKERESHNKKSLSSRLDSIMAPSRHNLMKEDFEQKRKSVTIELKRLMLH